MKICDGLNEYKKNLKYWEFTLNLEEKAEKILELLQKYQNLIPPKESMQEVRALLIDIEQWKAMCIQDQIGNAAKNSGESIWNSFQQAVKAMNSKNDLQAIQSIMSLIGFGSSRDPETGKKRAKRATAVLRFLNPHDWGVVDWRTIAVLSLLEKYKFNVDSAFSEARNKNPGELRKDLDLINENEACEIILKYRRMITPELPRAADVDMALFGLSMKVWPMR